MKILLYITQQKGLHIVLSVMLDVTYIIFFTAISNLEKSDSKSSMDYVTSFVVNSSPMIFWDPTTF